VIANRVAAENDRASPCHYVHHQEAGRFKDCMPSIGIIITAVHELFGHGTGKLLSETRPGVYNFDKANPPINPLTEKPVETCYLPGQTWNSVFGEIAGAVEECRAEVMSMYLIDNKELLSTFGHDDKTPITADESS
jgi:dipeptidyl-peptidase-3